MTATMTQIRKLAAGAAVLGLAIAGPASAHHSFAMFDLGKTETLTGVVKQMDWTNPHISLWVIKDGSGAKPDLWNFETTSPGNLKRAGWTSTTFKPGDKVQITYHPLRSGEHGGAFEKGVLTGSGKVITTRQMPPPPAPGA